MKYVLAIVMALGLAACGEPDAQRIKVQKELEEFNAKCQKNLQDEECKQLRAQNG